MLPRLRSLLSPTEAVCPRGTFKFIPNSTTTSPPKAATQVASDAVLQVSATATPGVLHLFFPHCRPPDFLLIHAQLLQDPGGSRSDGRAEK